MNKTITSECTVDLQICDFCGHERVERLLWRGTEFSDSPCSCRYGWNNTHLWPGHPHYGKDICDTCYTEGAHVVPGLVAVPGMIRARMYMVTTCPHCDGHGCAEGKIVRHEDDDDLGLPDESCDAWYACIGGAVYWRWDDTVHAWRGQGLQLHPGPLVLSDGWPTYGLLLDRSGERRALVLGLLGGNKGSDGVHRGHYLPVWSYHHSHEYERVIYVTEGTESQVYEGRILDPLLDGRLLRERYGDDVYVRVASQDENEEDVLIEGVVEMALRVPMEILY